MEAGDGVHSGKESEKQLQVRNRERWLLPLGMGALLAFWFLVFGRLGMVLTHEAIASWSALVGAAVAAMIACALVVGLLCMKDAYRVTPLQLASPLLFKALVLAGAVLLIGGCAASAPALFLHSPEAPPFCGAPLAVAGGTGVGAGFCLISLLYFEKLGRWPTCDCARGVACGLGWFALGSLAALPLPPHGGVYGIAAAVVALMAVAALAGAGVGAASGEKPQNDTAAALPVRLSSLVRSSWRLFAVVLICALMLGFNWDPSLLGLAQIAPSVALAQEAAGALVAACVLGSLRRAPSGAEALARLQRTVVPIVVATFVVVPYFPLESTGAAFYEFVGFVRAASILIFGGGFMLSLAVAARVADVSLLFAGALAGALSSLCLVAGHGIAVAFGAQASPLVVLLFVGYLVAIVAASSLGHGEEQRVREIERTVFDAYLQERCAEIAEQKGLSPRESEMLVYLGRGHGYVYIADLAFVSESTVRAHAKSIFKKCGVSSREELLDFIDQVALPQNRSI